MRSRVRRVKDDPRIKMVAKNQRWRILSGLRAVLYFAISGPGMADSSDYPSDDPRGSLSLADSLVASPLGFTAHFSVH